MHPPRRHTPVPTPTCGPSSRCSVSRNATRDRLVEAEESVRKVLRFGAHQTVVVGPVVGVCPVFEVRVGEVRVHASRPSRTGRRSLAGCSKLAPAWCTGLFGFCSFTCKSPQEMSRRADSNRLHLLQLRVSCSTVEREARSYVLSAG